MKRSKNVFPVITSAACRLFEVCLVIIVAYLLCMVTYIVYRTDDMMTRKNSLDMLHSVFVSAVIALGGTLLFDCELRRGGISD